jgi:homoserine O-acetyltransferase
LSVIELGKKYKADMRETMRAVMAIHQFALETPEYRAVKTPPNEFAAYRASFEKDAGERVTAEDWASQLRAMIAANAGPPENVKAKLLVVVALQDHMVNPQPAIDFARKRNADLLLLGSNCGHLAPGCETARVNSTVRAFLE